jgi:hypothetical protein
MKKLQYIIYIALLIVGYSCERDLESEGVSRTTSYLSFDLTNGPVVTIPLGTAYTEPGFVAKEGDKDVTASVKVEGTVDPTKLGVYTISYSGTNSDGFESSEERTVIVYDPAAPATDLTGNYISSVSRVAPARAYTGLSVSIQKMAPGFFYVSDFLGGFYDQGSNYQYGPTYAMTGYFILNADNSITHISSLAPAWGDSLNELVGGKYDPATETVTWDAFYTSSNFDFKVTLVKEEE